MGWIQRAWLTPLIPRLRGAAFSVHRSLLHMNLPPGHISNARAGVPANLPRTKEVLSQYMKRNRSLSTAQDKSPRGRVGRQERLLAGSLAAGSGGGNIGD